MAKRSSWRRRLGGKASARGGVAADRIRLTLLSLVAGEPPWNSALLESLVDGSDRLIVDIGEMTQIEFSLSALEHLICASRRAAPSAIPPGPHRLPGEIWWRNSLTRRQVLPYLGAIERLSWSSPLPKKTAVKIVGRRISLPDGSVSRLGWKSQQSTTGGLDSNRQHVLRDRNGRAIALEINPRFGMNQRNWWERDIYEATCGRRGHDPSLGTSRRSHVDAHFARASTASGRPLRLDARSDLGSCHRRSAIYPIP